MRPLSTKTAEPPEVGSLLRTERLVLRPFTVDDAPALQRLAGERVIADTMISVPHPFTLDAAHAWLARHAPRPGAAPDVDFAVCLVADGELVGSSALRDIDPEHLQAELSFWIGRPWWGQGLASEATSAVVRYGFETLGLNRIVAYHMVRNPASGRVLARLRFRQEGLLRQRVRKWGAFEDVLVHAVLRSDYAAQGVV